VKTRRVDNWTVSNHSKKIRLVWVQWTTVYWTVQYSNGHFSEIRFLNDKRQPFCKTHLKTGLFVSGFQMLKTSLDRFINKSHKIIFYSCQNGLG
jgi:hypothetical protein